METFKNELSFNFISMHIFYCCSSTVVSIPSPPISPAPSPPHPTLNPTPLWLCPTPLWLCPPLALYTCFWATRPLLSPIISLPPPLWSLSVCSLFHCLWLYFACFFVFHNLIIAEYYRIIGILFIQRKKLNYCFSDFFS